MASLIARDCIGSDVAMSGTGGFPDLVSAAAASWSSASAPLLTDLFISYSRHDRPVAEQLAARLSGLGWSVWWDKKIGAGQAFDRTTENAIATARLVLVIWSQNSVNSDWVRAEAGFALRDGKLLPVLIDDATPPLRFIHVHYLDLSGWDGSESATGLRDLAAEIADRLGGGTHRSPDTNNPNPGGSPDRAPSSMRTEAPEEKSKTSVNLYRWLAAGFGAVTIAAGVIYSTMGLVAPSGERGNENPPIAAQSTMIGDPVLFERNATALSESARSTIDRVAEYLRANPHIMVTIEGYCSEDEGLRMRPSDLAQLRANQVRNALKERGVTASRLQTVSYAKSRTAVVGANQAAQAQNRRVVVVGN